MMKTRMFAEAHSEQEAKYNMTTAWKNSAGRSRVFVDEQTPLLNRALLQERRGFWDRILLAFFLVFVLVAVWVCAAWSFRSNEEEDHIG